ncbi:MAG: ABC transporter substrate-binding protein [Thermoprotei archaeon]|nr:MAG: ABC transporter substrate-binding protein [Thermoprotei archaeon]
MVSKVVAYIAIAVIITAIVVGVAVYYLVPRPAPPAAPPPAKPPAKPAPPAKELIIYHWWTAGGEREAIDAVFKIFKEKIPGVKISENPIAGGAGAVMKPVIWQLLAAGTPPDTFQVHAGGELKEYVDAGYLEPVDDVWSELGLEKVIPGTLQAMCKFGGHYYAVPINVHRSNVLWYNPTVFKKLGIIEKFGDPRTWDLETLLKVCKYIKENAPKVLGKTVYPIAVATRHKWPLTHLFEVLLALHGGPEIYVKFWTGKFKYKDPKDPVWKAVRDVLRAIGIMAKEGYFNPDHPELTWDQAAAKVMKGECAMYIHGDWVAGYYMAVKAKYGEEWSAAPFPKKIFVCLSDCFNLPKKAPHRDIAIEWLRVVGSKEAQEKFNVIKGSIPARVDVKPKYPDPYRPETAEDWVKSTLVPSAVHGGLSKEAFVTAMHDILTYMISSIEMGTDVDKAVDYAVTQIAVAIERTGLVDFWKGYTIDYFITKR